MKKALPWILLIIAALVIVYLIRNNSAKVKTIMDQSDADLKVAESVIADHQKIIAESDTLWATAQGKYAVYEGKIQELEKALKKRPHNGPIATLSQPQPVFDWELIYRDYHAMNQGYIVSNQALRSEHDAMVTEHEVQKEQWKLIDLQRMATIDGLIETRDKLARIKSPLFYVVLGPGVSFNGRFSFGVQLTAGIRIL